QVKINNVVQIRNKPNSRVRFGIPASLLLFGNEETNLAMLVVKLVSPSVFLMWDSPLFASCESLRQTASSTRHALYAPSLLLSENRFIS
ncbi:hypothetical protein, partial [Enterobacter hormaechei]